MEAKELISESKDHIRQEMVSCRRQESDRRQDDCEGFTYVSTVGWICRREQSRRKIGDETS
jgi:hypothetical protein